MRNICFTLAQDHQWSNLVIIRNCARAYFHRTNPNMLEEKSKRSDKTRKHASDITCQRVLSETGMGQFEMCTHVDHDNY